MYSMHWHNRADVMQTFVSRTRLAVQRAEDLTATPFEEDNISVVPSDQGQAPGKHLNLHSTVSRVMVLSRNQS